MAQVNVILTFNPVLNRICSELTLKNPMFAITDELMDMSDIVKLIDDAEALRKKRGPYKKKAA
jgi:hypothetical protein